MLLGVSKPEPIGATSYELVEAGARHFETLSRGQVLVRRLEIGELVAWSGVSQNISSPSTLLLPDVQACV
jgi:hypothetical protein